MADDRLRRAAITATTCALALAIVACIPVPISHSEQVTPSVEGVLRRDDGFPAAGVTVAVTRSGDAALCERSAARAVTDSMGRFHVPAVTARKRVFWLSMAEVFGTGYWLCATPPSAQVAGAAAPTLHTQVFGRQPGDSIACLLWDWRRHRRVTCNGLGTERVVTGGSWNDGTARGSYRIILADLEAGGAFRSSRGYVQWIETSPTERRTPVRTIIELPTAADVATGSAVLATRDGRWYLTVTDIERAEEEDAAPLTFELGSPGKLRLMLDR